MNCRGAPLTPPLINFFAKSQTHFKKVKKDKTSDSVKGVRLISTVLLQRSVSMLEPHLVLFPARTPPRCLALRSRRLA